MRRYNDGMVYTNDNCVACNHCVHVCPAVGANVSSNDDGRISIDVSDKNCLHCGTCIRGCVHHARRFHDSFGDMLHDISRGAKIPVIIDPAFIVVYGEKKARNVFGYLRSLGITGIYDGSIGADISIYMHAKYLRENTGDLGVCDKFMSHNCPGFSNYVSRYAPDALDRFIPVQLPSVCAAIYYRKYRQIAGRFALLSPCTAMFDEFSSFNSGRNINYLIGFSTLLEHIGDTDISSMDAWFDIDEAAMGSVICENGGFSRLTSSFFAPEKLFKTYTGIGHRLEGIIKSESMKTKQMHPFMITVDMCEQGCVSGPAIDPSSVDQLLAVNEYERVYGQSMRLEDDPLNSPDERFARLASRFEQLNPLDFAWEGEENYHQKCQVPETVIEEIFASMHKTTAVKKELDCQACGYSSCREMASAVANGYSRIEDCVHYLNDEMKNQLGIDSLTQLYNQRGFFPLATRLVADNPDKRYVLAIGDINGLGGINDLYSNTGGDLVISYVSKVLAEFADGRGLCARIGSGTFAVIFENTEENMEKLKADTQVSIAHLGMEYPLSMKFGIYEMGDNSVTISRAVLYATYAYRTTNDKSRNTYVLYTDEMSKSMSEEAEVTQKMKSAMANGEFVIYLQPKFDHTSGRMVGAEVLSRWIKPDGEIVSPGVFIPVFEKNGYISELDRYVWKTSFETVSKWIDEGRTAVPVSVNISRISLLDEAILPFIEQLKMQYPKASEFIQFEITESAYAGNTDEIFGRVRRIQDMGFKIDMDDFGSGYSSLNLLKDAPIDIVKLDMGFLRGEDHTDRGKVIISAIVNMTRELGFDIIAEGVETKEQADTLASMGCSVIQGYYYARPMPEDDFATML
ncbi:MAG: EAL domain-containing protein [Lachnospiraceae bacterium]|nr:EAL domain-containing protein [Lachnospiraceae bacterium]